MDILIAVKKLGQDDPSQWARVMYRTFTMLGHNVSLKTFGQDIPSGFDLAKTGVHYDAAFLYGYDGDTIDAHCKVGLIFSEVDKLPEVVNFIVSSTTSGEFPPCVFIPFPVDLSDIINHGSTFQEILKDHDSIKVAYRYLYFVKQFLSLPRN